jgi:hypothetical protein
MRAIEFPRVYMVILERDVVSSGVWDMKSRQYAGFTAKGNVVSQSTERPGSSGDRALSPRTFRVRKDLFFSEASLQHFQSQLTIDLRVRESSEKF